MQEWLYRPRDVDLRFHASLRPQFALWLLGIELSPVLLRELGKAVATGKKKKKKKKKALAASKANATSASVLECHSGFGNEALTFCESLQLTVSSDYISYLSPPPVALHPGICSVTGPRARLHWRTSCRGQPATLICRGWAGICCGDIWARRSAKWVAQTPSQGFVPPESCLV